MVEGQARNRGLKPCAIPDEALREENLLEPQPILERRVGPESTCVFQDAVLGERAVDVELLDPALLTAPTPRASTPREALSRYSSYVVRTMLD